MSTGRPRGFRFPWVVIQHAVWLYARFTLSLRDVEELLAERGIVVTYETIQAWIARFGPAIARGLRARRGGSNGCWHLDEVFVSVGGRRMYLWRAVDGEGEVLDVLVQARRDKAAALRLMRKLLRKQGHAPDTLVTDRLGSYAAAASELGLSAVHVRARPANNRAEGSHAPIRRRERTMQGFRSPGSTQRFLSVHAAVANTFATFRHLVSAAGHRLLRADAFAAWRDAVARAASPAQRRPRSVEHVAGPGDGGLRFTGADRDPKERFRGLAPADVVREPGHGLRRPIRRRLPDG